MMIDAIATTRSLPWPARLPRQRRARLLAPGTRARAAARHGLRGAMQTLCLAAAMMAAVGAVGSSRGPVELNEPAHIQGGTAAVVAPAPTAAAASPVSLGLAHDGTWR